MNNHDGFLVLTIQKNRDLILSLSNPVRLQILDLLAAQELNINEIAETLNLPQSTVATNVAVLEKAGLVETKVISARKGKQKLCRTAYKEILIQLIPEKAVTDSTLEVEMPIGLYTNFKVTAPCGLCSPTGIIGYLDVPDSFLNPERMGAGLLWFETGWVEYQFPNNSLYKKNPLRMLEISLELSSETPGTNKNWLSDITFWINQVEIGTWTSPGDFGDKRGKFTPEWWKLEGSQYGLLKRLMITNEGSFIDGVKISSVTLSDLHISEHHSIRFRVGVKEDSPHPGGINIFGRGFGNYNQAIVMRMSFF